jgi:hypothetical protein
MQLLRCFRVTPIRAMLGRERYARQNLNVSGSGFRPYSHREGFKIAPSACKKAGTNADVEAIPISIRPNINRPAIPIPGPNSLSLLKFKYYLLQFRQGFWQNLAPGQARQMLQETIQINVPILVCLAPMGTPVQNTPGARLAQSPDRVFSLLRMAIQLFLKCFSVATRHRKTDAPR